MTPVGFAYLASALATGTGVAIAYRSRAHLPIALLLGFGLGADLAIHACGPSPSGWRFALSLSLGSAYPWAVLGVVSVSLRREERLGKEGARSHVGRSPSLRGGVGAQAAPGPADGVAQDGGGVGDCAGGVNEDPGDEVRRDDAEQAHTRILAPLALLFTLYLASLLSSGVRGPALARCYAVAQAGLGVGMAWVVRGWERRRKGKGPGETILQVRPSPSPPSPLAERFRVHPGRGGTDTVTRRAPTATEIAAIICAVTEMSLVPVYLNLPHWYGARAAYATCYILLIALHARALIGGPPCRPLTPYTSGGPRS